VSPVVGAGCWAKAATDTSANEIAVAKEINRIEILLPKAAILRPLRRQSTGVLVSGTDNFAFTGSAVLATPQRR
jgi:hypothetical protein